MEVYSKYNINDTVWVVSRNKVIQQKIQGIEITATNHMREIEYTFIGGGKLPEDKVFKTKQKLIDSL